MVETRETFDFKVVSDTLENIKGLKKKKSVSLTLKTIVFFFVVFLHISIRKRKNVCLSRLERRRNTV